MNPTNYQTILSGLINPLWVTYCQRVPQALKIYHLLEEHNKRVVHDHISFRTVNLPWTSGSVLTEKLGQFGYCLRDRASRPEQNLELYWLHHPAPEVPAILITELDVHCLSQPFQSLLKEITGENDTPPLWSLNHIPPKKPTLQQFETLQSDNEMAAWFSLFGTSAHYFSVSVNHLDRQNDMLKLVKLLMEEGFALDNRSGLIRESAHQMIEQVVSLPDQIEISFSPEEKARVSSGCYHFTLRFKSPSGKLYKKFFSDTFSRTKAD